MRELEGQADALLASGDHGGAIALYRRIVDGGEADDFIWCHLGDALTAVREYVEAVAAYEAALHLAPDQPELHINIARPLYLLGDAHIAAAHLERALHLGNRREALLNLAAIAPGVPRYGLRQVFELRSAFGIALRDAGKTPAQCLEEARTLAQGPRERSSDGLSPLASREPGTPLRIAYLSAHFDQPGYMGPVWGLINNHNRDGVRLFLLADSRFEGTWPDYRPHPDDTVVEVHAMDDGRLTECVAELGIDILVDLSAYSHTPRLSLFAKRVAPVVVAWFNMYATSGLPGIDYIVGDAHVVRPEEEIWYSEKVLRLPQSYLSFQSWEGRPPVAPAPCTQGVPFTFGSLVSLYKITEPVLDAWCAILRRVPESRLLLANANLKSANNRVWLLEQFVRRGVEEARILIRDPAPHNTFLTYYDAIDLALDSFPYSGGTTTMEALWQGVPVLTQAGEGWAARTTGSILVDTHLGEFCCDDIAHYVERGVALALDGETPVRFSALRATMRERLSRCVALDGAAFARHMERLFRAM